MAAPTEMGRRRGILLILHDTYILPPHLILPSGSPEMLFPVTWQEPHIHSSATLSANIYQAPTTHEATIIPMDSSRLLLFLLPVFLLQQNALGSTNLPVPRGSPLSFVLLCLLGLLLPCPFCRYLCPGTLGPMASVDISTTYYLPCPQSPVCQEGEPREGQGCGPGRHPQSLGLEIC